MAEDYGKTLNLPNTEFSMRANLPQREPEILKKWEDENMYEKLMENKARSLKGDAQARLKMLRFGMGRGYRYDEVAEVTDKIIERWKHSES